MKAFILWSLIVINVVLLIAGLIGAFTRDLPKEPVVEVPVPDSVVEIPVGFAKWRVKVYDHSRVTTETFDCIDFEQTYHSYTLPNGKKKFIFLGSGYISITEL